MKYLIILFTVFLSGCTSDQNAIQNDSHHPKSMPIEYGGKVYQFTDNGETLALNLNAKSDNYIEFEVTSTIDGVTGPIKKGALFESYVVVGKNPLGGDQVKDSGSQLRIEGKTFHLEWSKKSADSGYIYYPPSALVVSPK